MNVALRADRNEVRAVWFPPIQRLVWRLVLQRSSWASIFEICNCLYDLSPEFFWQLCVIQYGSDSFHDDPIRSFCNAILLWSVWCGRLMLDAEFSTILGHLLLVFATLVGTDGFDSPSILFECVSKFHELLSDLLGRFRLHGIQVEHSHCIIDEGQEVFVLAVGYWGKWSTDVTVDQIAGDFTSSHRRIVEVPCLTSF